MFKTIVSSFLSCMIAFSAQASDYETLMQTDDMIVTKLSNGLNVLIIADKRSPVVSSSIYVHAGSSYEDSEIAGISHVLEHMLFKGTETRPKGAIAKEISSVGGYLNAATSFDYTMYFNNVPSRHWKLGLDIVRDMVFHPLLDKNELESEKKVVIEELYRGKDGQGSHVFESIQQMTWAGTPYVHPIIGYEKTVNALTVEKLRTYMNTYYQPQSMTLVIAGNVDKDEVLKEVIANFSKYQNKGEVNKKQIIPVSSLKQDMPLVEVQYGNWNKVAVTLALPSPDSGDVRSTTLEILAQLLGGDKNSFFWKKYKHEKQMVDSINVRNTSFKRIGMINISASLDAENLDAFISEILKDLATLDTNFFTEEDLVRIKLNRENVILRSNETASGIASRAGRALFNYGNVDQAIINSLNMVKGVDKNAIGRAIKDWFNPNRLSIAVVAPEKNKEIDSKKIETLIQKNWTPEKIVEEANSKDLDTTVKEIDLQSNRKLVLIPDNSVPYISGSLLLSGGNSLLEPNQQGLSSLLSSVLVKRSNNMNSITLQEWLSDRSSLIRVDATQNGIYLSFTSPTQHSEEVFKLITDILENPKFDEEEFEREKQTQLAKIKSTQDQAMGYIYSKMPEFLFPNSVYGYTTLGTTEIVEKLTLKDVSTLWEKQKKQPWVLAIAGDFDAELYTNLAKKLIIPTVEKIQIEAPIWGKEKELNLTLHGRNQAHYLLVFETASVGDKDVPALMLLQNVLSGMGGILFRDLRDEKGLAYTVRASQETMKKTGYMNFYIGTNPKNLQTSEEGFRNIINSLHTSLLPDAEIERAKNQLEGSYARKSQTFSSRASDAARLLNDEKGLGYERKLIDEALKLNAKDLQEVAKKYLIFDKAYTVKLLPN